MNTVILYPDSRLVSAKYFRIKLVPFFSSSVASRHGFIGYKKAGARKLYLGWSKMQLLRHAPKCKSDIRPMLISNLPNLSFLKSEDEGINFNQQGNTHLTVYSIFLRI